MKQYQTVSHSEILTYPQHNQDEILSSVFRIKGDDIPVKEQSINEHFKKPIKSYGRGRFVKKNKDFHYKE